MSHQPTFAGTKALSFDIYGTLVDWESGILKDLLSLTSQLERGHECHPQSPDYHKNTIAAFNKQEHEFCRSKPKALYEDILSSTYCALAAEWGLQAEPAAASQCAANIESWEPFPDTIAAMQKLGQRYKLVPLSNISFAAFDKTMRGPLKDVKWDATCIAEAIGSYKPDHHNFQYLLDTVQEKLGIEKNELVHIAHGVSTDQIPAEEMGIDHVWIRRGLDAATTEGVQRGQLSYETLGDLADDLVQ